MRSSGARVLALSLAALLSTSLALAQDFSLDDCPNAPLGGTTVVPGECGAEAPWGVGPFLAPSPSLGVFGLIDSDILVPAPGLDVPMLPVEYLNALSANHWKYAPSVWPVVRLRFSVDRTTRGLAGTATLAQFFNNQQAADIFDSSAGFQHPCSFVGLLGPGPYSGVLPTAGGGGGNVLARNQTFFGLSAGGYGIPAGAVAPVTNQGTHDNIDAYNDLPWPKLDTDGDGQTNYDFYYSTYPAELAPITGIPPAEIWGVAAFTPPPGVLWAMAPQLGLDVYGGVDSDDVDGLVVWANKPLNNEARAGVDCAIFSLSPGSATLTALQTFFGLPADAATIFMTDFTGAFAVYAFGTDIGLPFFPPGGPPPSNVDGLEIRQ